MNPGLIEEIERQIDATRHALDRTIRALQFELSPQHQIEEAWRAAKHRTGRSLRAGANWAVAHQVPIAVASMVLVAAAVCVAKAQSRRN